MRLLPQGTTCIANGNFTLKMDRRRLTVKIGQRFWITNAAHNQESTQRYDVARLSAPMGTGFPLTSEQFDQVFSAE